jgi:hypothetical protein
MVQRATLMSRSVQIAEDDASCLTAAADKGGVSQNDLIRLGLHRLRKELGAAEPEKARHDRGRGQRVPYKLASPRAAGKRARES